MVEYTELYKASLSVDSQIDTSSLDRLKVSADAATAALQNLSTIRVSFDTSPLASLETAIRGATVQIRADFQLLSQEVVGHSIIPEMLSQIEAAFATLPVRTNPALVQLRNEFLAIRPAAQQLDSAVRASTNDMQINFQRLAAELVQMGSKFNSPENQADIASMAQSLAMPVQDTIQKLGELQAKIKQTAEVGTAIKTMVTGIAEVAKLQQLTTTFDTIRASSENMGASFANVRGGIQLIAGGGNVFTGLRQVILGASDSTSIFVKGLDWLADRTQVTSAATNKFAQEVQRLSGLGGDYARQMVAMAEAFKPFLSEANLSVNQTNKFERSIVELRAQWDGLNRTIEAGGKPSAQAVAAVGQAAHGVLVEIQTLRTTMGDMIPPQVKAGLDALEVSVRQQANASNIATTQSKMYHAELAKEAVAAKTAATAGTQRQTVFQKIQVTLSNLLGITTNSTTVINNNTQAIRQQTAEFEKQPPALARARDGVLGFIGAFAAFTGLQYLFSNLGFMIQGIGQKFFEVNNIIQNFSITTAQMLNGTMIDIESATAGAMQFIMDVAQKTPFEIQDAVQAFQKLVIIGLDPKLWLEPIANAAAALNKPMEQLEGAIQRILVGDIGQGIMMMRDFGINVNNVGIWVDRTTGKLATQAEVAGKTNAELEAAGLAWQGWEFDKTGKLMGDNATALNQLNGYLQQNATFAGAAEARSKSLQGIMSNLADTASRFFMVLGAPIMEVLTTQGTGLLNMLNQMQPVLNGIATSLGTYIATGIQWATTAIANFQSIWSGILPAIQDAVWMIQSIFSGDWQGAWGIFLQAIVDGLSQAESFFSDFVAGALEWGYNYVVEIANGIIEAANSVLVEALNYVGEMMASFMEPGSPPEKGPLSDIDKWGAGDMTEFLKGFKKGDFTFLQDVLEQVNAAFDEPGHGNLGNKKEAELLNSLRQDLEGLMIDMNETGIINEEMWSKIKAGLDSANPKLAANIRLQLEMQQASAKVAAVQKKIAEAEKKGYVPAALKLELETAQAEVESKKDALSLQDEYLNFQQQQLDMQKKLVGGMASAAKAMASAAKAMSKAKEKEVVTAQQQYDQEKAMLDEKYKNGIISEKDYTAELLKIEEKFVDSSLKSGVPAGIEAHYTAIKELQAKMETFKKEAAKTAALEGARATAKPLTPAEIFKQFQKDTPKLGEQVGVALFDGIRKAVPQNMPLLMADLWESMKKGLKTLFDNFRAWLEKVITPENFKMFALIAGILAKIVSSPILKGLQKLGGFLGIATGSGGGFLAILGKLLLSAAKFATVGGIILTILLNWDTIWARLGPVVDTVVKTLADFAKNVLSIIVEKLGGAGEAAKKFQDALSGVLGFASEVGKVLGEFLLSGDFGALGEKLMAALSDLAKQVGPFLQGIFAGIGQAILNALPPQVLQTINNVRNAVAAFFQEGRLGGELLNLFRALGEYFQTVWPYVATLFKMVGATILVALALIGDAILALLQALWDAGPFIENTLSGIVRFITGVIDTFRGFFGIVTAVILALQGNTDQAQVKMQQALSAIQLGFGEMGSGIVQAVTGAFSAIMAIVFSFAANFVNNIRNALGGSVQIFGMSLDQIADTMMSSKEKILTTLQGMLDNVVSSWYLLANQLSTALVKLAVMAITGGTNFVNGIRTGIEQAWGAVVIWFNSKVQELLKPINDLKTGIEGIFTGLQNNLVTHSIVPDTTNSIVLLFSGILVPIQSSLAQLNIMFSLTFSQMTLTYSTFHTAWLIALQTVIMNMITAFNNMLNVFRTVIDAMKSKVDEFISKLLEICDSVDTAIESMEKINNIDYTEAIKEVKRLQEAFEKMAISAREARNSAKVTMDSAQKETGAAGYQTGTSFVPRTGPAILHRGEVVFPPDIGEAWRNLMGVISRVGVGDANWGLPAFAMAAARNADAFVGESTLGQGGERPIQVLIEANVSDDYGFQKFANKTIEVFRTRLS